MKICYLLGSLLLGGNAVYNHQWVLVLVSLLFTVGTMISFKEYEQ